MLHELIDPALPPNREVLEYLRGFAREKPDDHFSEDGWELHTHPDLTIQIEELVPEGQPVVHAYGVAVVPVNGIIAIAAPGMYRMMVRIPVPPDLQEPPDRRPRDSRTELPAGWHGAPAFGPQDMNPKLRELIVDALRHAAQLT